MARTDLKNNQAIKHDETETDRQSRLELENFIFQGDCSLGSFRPNN